MSLVALFSDSNLASSKRAREKALTAKLDDFQEGKKRKKLIIEKTYSVNFVPSKDDSTIIDLDIECRQIISARDRFNRHGFVCLDPSSDSPSSSHSSHASIIDQDLLQAMWEAAVEIDKEVSSRLKELDICFSNETLTTVSKGMHTTRSERSRLIEEAEMNSSFKFLEISSRCFGRLDIKYGMDKEPFDDKRLKEHPPFLPLIQSLLGEDAELRYSGLITSYPGSSDQPFHGDGPHLFEKAIQLPTHAVNVFIPLHDISEELGPTEIIPGTHLISNVDTVHNHLKNNNIKVVKDRTIAPLMKRGSILLYDYRVLHRGTGNKSGRPRYMFYMLYVKPWFKDHINFGDVSMFSKEALNCMKKTNEDPTCRGYYEY